MATQIDARVKQKTGVAADFAGYNLLEGEIALVRTSASGPVWNFKVGPGNFDSLDWSLQNPGAAQEADTSTVFPTGVPGLYIPTEDGNYDGVTVDLSVGYVQLIWDGTTLVKVEFPIDLSGYTQAGGYSGTSKELDDRLSAAESGLSGVEDVFEVTSVRNGDVISNITPNDGYYVNPTGGLNSNADYAASDFVPVVGGKQYRYDGAMFGTTQSLCWYDESQLFISGFQAGNGYDSITPLYTTVLTAPDNAKFVRFGRYKTRASSASITYVDPVAVSTSGVKDAIYSVLQLLTLKNGDVISNETPNDGYINSVGGVNFNASWKCSDFVAVPDGKALKYDGAIFGTSARIACYRADKSLIEAIAAGTGYDSVTPLYAYTFTPPPGTAYVRWSLYTTRAPSASLTYVDTEPYSGSNRLDAIEAQLAGGGSVRWSVPSILYAVVGLEKSIYFDNCCLSKGLFVQIRHNVNSGQIGNIDDRRFYITPNSGNVGDHSLEFIAADQYGAIVSTITRTLRIIAKPNLSATGKNLLWIGDSIGDNRNLPAYINQALETASSAGTHDVVFIGTRNANPGINANILHESRAGWSIDRYMKRTMVTDGTAHDFGDAYSPRNPFWRMQFDGGGAITSEGFDATYYREVTYPNYLGSPVPAQYDLIVFQVAYNDSREEQDAAYITARVNDLKTLIGYFKDDSPSCKFIVSIPTFEVDNYGSGRTSLAKVSYRALQIQRMREGLINAFDNGAEANVVVADFGLCIDRWFGYPRTTGAPAAIYSGDTIERATDRIHPTAEGVQQLAEGITPIIVTQLS